MEEQNSSIYNQYWEEGKDSNVTESTSEDDEDEEEEMETKENKAKQEETHNIDKEESPTLDNSFLKEEIKNTVTSEQRTCDVDLQIDTQKETNITERQNEKNFNEVIEKQVKTTLEPMVKDTKINGKFEVSIIREEEIQKILQVSCPSVNTNSKSVKLHQCEKFDENISETSSSHLENVTSESSPKKSKHSSRRVSFGEPRYIEAESPDRETDSDTNATLRENGENSEDETTVQINFKHSNIEKTIIKEGNNDIILSPKDIYRLFCQPKSILKRPLSGCYADRSILSYDYNILEEKEEPVEEMSDAARSVYNIVRRGKFK